MHSNYAAKFITSVRLRNERDMDKSEETPSANFQLNLCLVRVFFDGQSYRSYITNLPKILIEIKAAKVTV